MTRYTLQLGAGSETGNSYYAKRAACARAASYDLDIKLRMRDIARAHPDLITTRRDNQASRGTCFHAMMEHANLNNVTYSLDDEFTFIDENGSRVEFENDVGATDDTWRKALWACVDFQQHYSPEFWGQFIGAEIPFAIHVDTSHGRASLTGKLDLATRLTKSTLDDIHRVSNELKLDAENLTPGVWIHDYKTHRSTPQNALLDDLRSTQFAGYLYAGQTREVVKQLKGKARGILTHHIVFNKQTKIFTTVLAFDESAFDLARARLNALIEQALGLDDEDRNPANCKSAWGWCPHYDLCWEDYLHDESDE